MHTERVTAKEFAGLFKQGMPGVHLYNSVPFSELMAHVCHEVHYVVLRDSRVRAGIVLGERDGLLRSPFSAPFGGFSFTRRQNVDTVFRCVEALQGYGALPKRIVLPPSFMFPEMYPAQSAALQAFGRLEYTDVNCQYPLCQAYDVEANMEPTARQKLHQAEKQGLEFEAMDATDEVELRGVYDVIKANRDAHGYPLRMSFEQVQRTMPAAKSIICVLRLGSVDVAAALVHTVTPKVAQVVYWGDVPGFSDKRPMNLLAACMFRHFNALGFKTLDIGPSSEEGTLDAGLCSFKESLGCHASLKPTFTLE